MNNKVKDILQEIKNLERYKLAVESAKDAIFFKDLKSRYVLINRKTARVFGLPRAKIIGKNDYVLLRNKEEAKKNIRDDRFVFKTGKTKRITKCMTGKDGKQYWFQVVKVPQFNKRGKVIGLVGIARDITKLRLLESKVKYDAYHDSLTEVYNRYYFEEDLKRINIKRNYPISIILIDVNHLKIVNDTFGHQAGDNLLKFIADKLKKSVRKDDMVARIGGDEFIILLKKTNKNRVEILEKKLKRISRFKNIDNLGKISIKTSCAIGCITLNHFISDIHSLIPRTDEEMYRDKVETRGTTEKEFINSLIEIMRQKDFHTQAHERRMKELAVKIGKKFHLSSGELKDLILSTMLHDIGKVGVPDKILKKKNHLTKKEWKKMKMHSVFGYNILKGLLPFMRIANYILYHHERWDGGGYPKGLRENEIPLISRIIAIVDSYDAIIHKRPYSKAKDGKWAIKELKRERGKQFDPKVVDIFLQIL